MSAPAISPRQFSLLRVVLALYLCVHFVGLMPAAEALFSGAGMASDPTLLPGWGRLPNLFALSDSVAVVWAALGCGALLSICLGVGWRRRWSALALWLLWASLFGRNPLISNPGMPYIGVALLLMAALPRGEPLALDPPRPGWRLPAWLPGALLVSLMAGYTVSGLHKLSAPSWIDGSALSHVLALPIARDTSLREWVLSLPPQLLQLASWGALGLEILALPLSLWRVTAPWVWLALTAMNLGILTLIDFADLTFGVLVFHLFAFDGSWLPPARFPGAVVFFDGVCNLCNGAVDFILAEDASAQFRFAPTQGETARRVDAAEVQEGKSMALEVDGVVYTRTDAVLRVAAGLGGHWRVLSWSRFIPRWLRDGVYEVVQRNRYAWFGQRQTCRLPTADEQERFLP